jgi:hypothetical protein
MAADPTPNRSDGRDEKGRFVRGNPGGPGNPYARKVGQLRAALLRAVSAKDVQDIIRAMVERAQNGDTQAAREVLDRVLGKPLPADIEERLSALEEIAEEKNR